MLGKQAASGFDAGQKRMKKVLILTAGYGEGHNTAARNIGAAIEAVSGGAAEARVFDPLDAAYGQLNTWAKKAYLATINHAPALWQYFYGKLDDDTSFQSKLPLMKRLSRTLAAMLDAERPDAVVSTYPLYNYFIESIWAARGEAPPFSRVTVITDSITINAVWYRTSSDAFIAANEDTASVLLKRGVPAEKVRVLGFPVALRFADRASLQAAPKCGEPWRVLYVINSGKKQAPELTRRLLDIEGVELTVTAGRDDSLRRTIEGIIAETGKSATVLGWTDRLPELMCQSHLLISKAGGATVQESLAACAPMVITQVIPGQEEGNAQLLIDNDCGVLAPSLEEIIAAVRKAFADGGRLWQHWFSNIDRIRRADAARDIARFVLKL